ncbi:MAG TPA: hypothetical protein VFM37_16705 [Pseudonocardiaceae bacterium]|nr:hypothetical protein [Pseudonocardiaceae bacterium]
MWADGPSGRIDSGFAYGGSDSPGIKLRVDQHNVMQAARIVQAEAERFRARIEAGRDGLEVFPVGGDPVSVEAARVLNEKFWSSEDSYYERCLEYSDMLRGLAHQLGQAAMTYGNTEDEVRSMFEAAASDAALP